MYLIKPTTELGLRMFKYLKLRDTWVTQKELEKLSSDIGFHERDVFGAIEELKQTVSIGQKDFSFRYYVTDEAKLISNLEWFDELP